MVETHYFGAALHSARIIASDELKNNRFQENHGSECECN